MPNRTTLNRFPMPRPGQVAFGSFRFDEDQDASGTAGGGDAEGQGGSSEPQPLSRKEQDKIIRARDSAKLVNRALMEGLGLEDVEWVDDEDRPGKQKPLIKGLDKIRALLDGADPEKGKPKAEKLAELERQHAQKLDKVKTTAEKRIGGLQSLVGSLAVDQSLPAILAAEGCVDVEGEDAGKFIDQIALLKPTIKVELEEDEDNPGQYSLAVYPVGADGSPRLDNKGNRISIRQHVKEFLAKRPHLLKADYRRGPGAGGTGPTGPRGRGQPSVNDHAKSVAAEFFGRKTQTA